MQLLDICVHEIKRQIRILQLLPLWLMKACTENWNKGSHILNPDTKWKWLISVTLRALICYRNNCLYSILQIRRWVGPKSSTNLVVKTGITATDKKVTSDHPISVGGSKRKGGVEPLRFEEMFSNHMNFLSHCSFVCLK